MNFVISTESCNRIGIFEVLREAAERTKDGHKKHIVRCTICGRTTVCRLQHIKNVTECRHLNRNNDYIDFQRRWSSHRLAKIYSDMIDRCYNQNDRGYRFYGEKGIQVCEEWKYDSKIFEDWAILNGYTDEMTIDRVDPTKDYSPENCRWIPGLDNSKYKSTTRLLTVDGETHTGRDWSKELSLGITTINTYLRKYPEDTVKEFIRRRLDNPNITRKSKQTWLDAYGLS